MASSSEEVHLMVNKVRHKKKDGVLYLMSERIAWCPQGRDQFELSHQYADIKCQKISPEGKPKIQLQIVLLNSDAVTFHFTNSNSSQAKEERNSVKDILSEVLPKFRRKMDKEIEEKNRLLQENPELFQTYKDLVGSQVITPEEFWVTHSSKLTTSSSNQSKQSVGVSASFLTDVKPQSDGCNGLRYNLTADRIGSIFRTYPAVKKKYVEKVPDKLSEKEFWTMFFQSHYFHRDRVNQSSKDMFSDCAKKDENDVISILKQGVKDPLVDLNSMDDEDSTRDEGYGTTNSTEPPSGKVKQSSTHIMNKAIIKRFNHQSAMILSTSLPNQNLENGSHGAGDTDDVTQGKKMRLRAATLYDDLDQADAKQYSSLSLQKSERYSHGPTAINDIHGELDGRNVLDGLQVVRNQCKAYKPRLANVLSTRDASAVMSDLSDGDYGSAVNESFIDHLLPAKLQTDFQHLYASSTELLRHFWLCFPVNSPSLQEKVVRIFNSIVKYRQTRLDTFKTALMQNRVEVNVAQHIEDMFDNACTKFNSWQSKKFRR